MQPPTEFKLEDVLAAAGLFVAWLVGNLIADRRARRGRANVPNRENRHASHEHCEHESKEKRER